LELVDIVTNAVRRALMGNLQMDAWKRLPSLMIHRNSHYIAMLALTNMAAASNRSYMAALQHFSHGGKIMLK
jgi:hypothetical protein